MPSGRSILGREFAPEPSQNLPVPLVPETTLAAVVGHSIEELRQRQGLDQRTLARRLGISESHLAAVEFGTRTPRLSLLVRMAATLEVTLDGLLGDAIEPTPLRDPRLIRCMRGIEAMEEEGQRYVVLMLEAILKAYRELISAPRKSAAAEFKASVGEG